MGIKETLRKFTAQRRGLLATNYYNVETLHGLLRAASEENEPLILQLTNSSIEYMGLNTAVNLGRSGLEQFNVNGWIHLDHGGSVELVHRCLDAGFDSVMIDGSELSFKENVRITQQAVKLAREYGVHIEAELGFVAKLGQSTKGAGFTQPKEAKLFVEETGVDALAIAIGTAHGFYKSEPKLQLELLEKIARVTPSTLVLHGSSGVPHNQVREAISRGICKINLATEIKNVFMKTLQSQLRGNEEIDLRKVFPVATNEVTALVKDKLRMVKNEANAAAIL